MYRLLVCDDAADYRALLRTVLGDADDFEIVGQAGHGRECLERLPEVRPDVVLLDVDMPLMNGFEALPRLREQSPATTVIVLSTAWTPEMEQQALELGAVAYLQKPRNVFDLPNALREALKDVPADERLGAGDLVERLLGLWCSGDRDAAYALLDDEVCWKPLRRDEEICGLDKIQEFLATIGREHASAEVTPLILLEREQNVVVLGHSVVNREHLSTAWVFRVEGARIAHVKSYADWVKAQSDAGISPGVPHAERRLAS